MYSPLQICFSDLIHLVGVMKTKSKAGRKKLENSQMHGAHCITRKCFFFFFLVQERVNTYLPNQPPSACARLSAAVCAAAGFMPAAREDISSGIKLGLKSTEGAI